MEVSDKAMTMADKINSGQTVDSKYFNAHLAFLDKYKKAEP